MQQKDLTKGSSVQRLNERSIEYDFAVPTYAIKSLGIQQELPPFEATCEIFKDNVTYACIREPTSQKKVAKQNAAAKILEILPTSYIILVEETKKCLVIESNFF